MTTRPNSFPATIAIIVIFSGSICLLSGLCTGLYAWVAETGPAGSLTPKHWYEAVIWGAMAFIPAGLFFWSGLRQWRRGNNKTSGIILAGLGFIDAGLFAWLIFSVTSDLRRLLRLYARVDHSVPISPHVYALLILSILAALSLWFVFVGLKIFFNTRKLTHTPETFE